MAFSITVHLSVDDALYRSPPDNIASEDFDRWINECQGRLLYENPLGAGGTVFNLWHVPAQKLGLMLLGSIYDNGLRVEGLQLVDLSQELDMLEWFWASMDLTGTTPLKEYICDTNGLRMNRQIPLADHLLERIKFLREAIRLAQEFNGVVDIR